MKTEKEDITDSQDTVVALKRKQREQKILSFVGLATKAGKTVSGAQAVEDAAKRKKAFLIIASADSSESTYEKIRKVASQCRIPIFRFSTKDEIGKFVGKQERAIAAITDIRFADQLELMIKDYLRDGI